ncbi:MAG: hypothetical protein HW387_341 [Parachlamydiales bacterium]|nr:hypothetical protein [Parachlamydiales bacterium]
MICILYQLASQTQWLKVIRNHNFHKVQQNYHLQQSLSFPNFFRFSIALIEYPLFFKEIIEAGTYVLIFHLLYLPSGLISSKSQ